jgi:hypothetical protein
MEDAMRLFLSATALMLGIGSAIAMSDSTPIVDIGAGAKLIGPLSVSNGRGDIVLYIEKGSEISIAPNLR